MFRIFVTLLCALALYGCGEQPAQSSASATASEAAASAPSVQQAASAQLMFFINPQGNPCRMQDAILSGMAEELAGKVSVTYVRTDVPDQRSIFYAYGIRALPSIVLTDGAGQEIKRLAPGVRPAEAIRELLTLIPQD